MSETFPADTTPEAEGAQREFSDPDPRWETAFYGLLYLGQMTSTFEWCGHKIVIHNLRTDEELLAANVAREWGDTIGATLALVTSTNALAVDSIDGQPMPVPLGETGKATDQWARERFAYAQKWYRATHDAIYTEYMALQGRVAEILGDLGKGSTQEDATPGSQDSSGSLTEEES